MIRKLVLTATMLMVFVTTRVMALGLGELTLHSYLNEPLNAEIELLSVHPDELDGIKIALASQRDFELIGVDRLYFLTTLEFVTKTNKAGNAIISITTKDPIKEPFLDFVIEVNWAKGRMLREYTTLVDPPTFAQEAPAPVKQAKTKTKTSVVRETVVPVPEPEPQPVIAEEEAPLFPTIPIEIEEDEPGYADPDTYGPTKRTDTLWAIARKVRPNSRVSIEQVMQALLKKNPQAFYNNNINDMKAGYVLRIPDLEEVTALSKRDAGRLSRAQYKDWKAARAKATHITTSAPGEGALMAPDMTSTTDGGPRLKLLSPEEEARLMAKQGGEDQAGSGSAMQDGGTSAISEEAEALRARVSELESQLSDMEQALAIKDEALAGFQKEMQVKPAITAQPLPQTESEMMAEPEQSRPVPAVKPKVTPKPTVERGFVDDLLDSPLMLAGAIAIVLILGALIWMVIGKRRVSDMQMDFQESILTGSGAPEPATAEAAPLTEEPEGKKADSSFLSEFSVSGIEGIQTEVSDVDPVAEADVYLAYGGFKQAEDLLKDALNNDPARPELKVKLLEVYSLANNADAFQALAEEFYASLGGEQSPVWNKVVTMGQNLCPENPLFAGGEEIAASETLSEVSPIPFSEPLESEPEAADLSDTGMEDSSLGMDLPEEGGLDLDLDINLDLDADALGETAETEEAPDLGHDRASLGETLDGMMSPEDTGLGESAETGLEESVSFDSETVSEEDNSLDLDMNELEASLDETSEEDLSIPETEFEDSITVDDLEKEVSAPATAFEDSAVDGGLYTEEDEIGTKLDLAKAYIDMGDPDGAKNILEEVLEEGNETQQHEARDLISQMQQ